MQQIIVITLYLLSIFIPLIFTPINLELFEFPKFIILLSGTIIIAGAWLVDYYHTRNLRIKLNLISYSVLLILATQTLATIFSINPYTSFWGFYSRFHQGLLTTICYSIIYFAAASWLDKKSTLKLIKVTVITSILVGLYAILEHFGIDKNYWVQDVQNRPFSTLGQPNWLAAYLIPNIFLTFYLSQINKKSSTFFSISSLILFTALIFTKSRSGIISFGFSYLAYWFLLIRQFNFKLIKTQLVRSSLILLIPTVIFGTSFTPSLYQLLSSDSSSQITLAPSGTVLETGGTESGDIRKIVWSGALKLITKYPLLGTGPETFAYTYYWQRPITHNMTSEWDFLYNKAHNEYLNIASGAGLIGLLAYLYWHFAVLSLSFNTIPKTKKASQVKEDNLRFLYPVLGASIIAFTITNFFGFSVIPVYLLLTLISALPQTIGNEPQTSSVTSPIYYLLIFIPLLYSLNIFVSDVNYAKGKRYLDAGQLAKALPLLQKAVSARPGLDLFHATLGEAYAAIGQTNKALEQISINKAQNPYHLNFYKSRAKIYLTLASIDPKYHAQAAEELENARRLAPTDPKLAYNLGLVYTRLDDLAKAEVNLKDAISLKPNYAEPYYALTLLYEQSRQLDAIPDLLQSAKSNLSTYSGQLKDKIDKYVTH
jgi:O-antigen ligase/Tfp pilus assembly protein PilF